MEKLDTRTPQDKTEMYAKLAEQLREAQARLDKLLSSKNPDEARIEREIGIIKNLTSTVNKKAK